MLRRVAMLSVCVSLLRAGTQVVSQPAEVINAPRDLSGGRLLFPFVVSGAGFDTEVTISNTSADTSGTPGQGGTCTLVFQGGGDGPSSVQETPFIAPGSQVVFTLSQ